MLARTFEFTAGCLALNFVDTVAGRTASSHDLLESPEALSEWAQAAGLVAAEPIVFSGTDLRTARQLREAIYRGALAIAMGRNPNATDVDVINAAAALPALRPQLVDGAVNWIARKTARAALSVIAADAVLCLSNDQADRLRQCPDCGMLFQDNSRRQNRKWCSSASGCGNRAKVRRHRAAQRGDDAS